MELSLILKTGEGRIEPATFELQGKHAHHTPVAKPLPQPCELPIWQQNEQCHEIMALFVLCKVFLQTRMRSHQVRLDVWFLVRPFVSFHRSCVRAAKALASLRRCAGLPEPSLIAGSNHLSSHFGNTEACLIQLTSLRTIWFRYKDPCNRTFNEVKKKKRGKLWNSPELLIKAFIIK